MTRLRWIKVSLAAFIAAAPVHAQQYSPPVTGQQVQVPSTRAGLGAPVMGSGQIGSPTQFAPMTPAVQGAPVGSPTPGVTPTLPPFSYIQGGSAPQAKSGPETPKTAAPDQAAPAPTTNGACAACGDAAAAPAEPPLGPTPLSKVGILQKCIFGDCDKPCLNFSGWLDADYTYRSTGSGQNNIAPVMNRFGDEALMRQIGLYISKPTDPNCWSWGFNSIFIAGSDASFLGPTAGGWANTDPRFGAQWTDLNLTIHAPILTEGGVDFKIGRQTTCLGPMGTLPWQRYFDSSDYAWYNMEEGRYTGVSSVWHVNKQLDIYNGIEFGWGEFFDYYSPAPQYLGQVSYWLDEKAEKCKVWSTVLTGPTGMHGTGNTTVVEVGVLANINKCMWDILDTQIVYSKCPIFGPKPPGYIERAYDVYNYFGVHLNSCWDLNTRVEWYLDVDGGGYAGGFGIPNTNYFEGTVGLDYHPIKWLQVRPEVRYDYATNPAFGQLEDKKNQVSVACDVLIKF